MKKHLLIITILIVAIILITTVYLNLNSKKTTEFKVIIVGFNATSMTFNRITIGTVNVPVSIPLSDADACIVATATVEVWDKNETMSCDKITHTSSGLIDIEKTYIGVAGMNSTSIEVLINETAKEVYPGHAI